MYTCVCESNVDFLHHRFTKSDHEALVEIFKKIGQKELTKVGIFMLLIKLALNINKLAPKIDKLAPIEYSPQKSINSPQLNIRPKNR